MINLTDIDSFWDILAVAIVVFGTIAVAVGPVLIVQQRKHNRETSRKLDAANEQLANGHPDPLRADLDKVLAGQAALSTQFGALTIKVDATNDLVRDQGRDISGIRSDVGAIRGEAREDRSNLVDLESRIVKFVRREHPGAAPP